MLRISKMADYAIIIMSCFSGIGATPLRAQDVADITGIASPTVRKLLQSLVNAKLLVSAQGSHGGYILEKSFELVSIVEIIEAIDGPIALTDCTSHNRDCALLENCSHSIFWSEINSRIRNMLGEISLAELNAKNMKVESL